MVPRTMRVQRVRRETADTVTLTLDSSGHTISFEPGQFNMLYAFAVGEVPISISGDPNRVDELVHTIKVVGAVTRALCQMRKDDAIGVRGPYGRGWPIRELAGADLLIIAGGIGFAALRALVLHVLRHRPLFGQISLLFGARTPGDLLFPRDFSAWQKRTDMQTLVTVDRAEGDWRGRVGVVPALLSEVPFERNHTVAFLCGPEVMMRFCVRELERRGLPDEHIYLSMERNMKCAVGFCGHCQYRENFLCKDGPVIGFERIRSLFWQREI
jgi:NAD(P)H-flavin reductase